MPDECQSPHMRAAAVGACKLCNSGPANNCRRYEEALTFATLYCTHCMQSWSRLVRPAIVACPLSGRTRIVVHLQQASPWVPPSLQGSSRRPGDADRGCELALGCGLHLVNRCPTCPRESEHTPWHHQRTDAAMCLHCDDLRRDPGRC